MTESPFSWTSGGTTCGQLTVRANTWDEMTDKLAQVASDPQNYIEATSIALASFKAAALVHAPAPVAALAAAVEPVPQWAAPFPAAPIAPALPQPVAAAGPPAGHMCDCGLPMALKTSAHGGFYVCSKPWRVNGAENPDRCKKKVNL